MVSELAWRPDAALVTTDGPLPEPSDLVAGWYMIDVESHERAVELAAYVPAGEDFGAAEDARGAVADSQAYAARGRCR
jgi:hypothetical protein